MCTQRSVSAAKVLPFTVVVFLTSLPLSQNVSVSLRSRSQQCEANILHPLVLQNV